MLKAHNKQSFLLLFVQSKLLIRSTLKQLNTDSIPFNPSAGCPSGDRCRGNDGLNDSNLLITLFRGDSDGDDDA